MTDSEIAARGSQAEEFLRYYNDNPYFQSVVGVAKQIVTNKIMNLKPDQQIEFTILKSQMTVFDDLFNLVNIDVFEGQKAVARIQGEPAEGKYAKGAIL